MPLVHIWGHIWGPPSPGPDSIDRMFSAVDAERGVPGLTLPGSTLLSPSPLSFQVSLQHCLIPAPRQPLFSQMRADTSQRLNFQVPPPKPKRKLPKIHQDRYRANPADSQETRLHLLGLPVLPAEIPALRAERTSAGILMNIPLSPLRPGSGTASDSLRLPGAQEAWNPRSVGPHPEGIPSSPTCLRWAHWMKVGGERQSSQGHASHGRCFQGPECEGSRVGCLHKLSGGADIRVYGKDCGYYRSLSHPHTHNQSPL